MTISTKLTLKELQAEHRELLKNPDPNALRRISVRFGEVIYINDLIIGSFDNSLVIFSEDGSRNPYHRTEYQDDNKLYYVDSDRISEKVKAITSTNVDNPNTIFVGYTETVYVKDLEELIIGIRGDEYNKKCPPHLLIIRKDGPIFIFYRSEYECNGTSYIAVK